MPKLIDPKSGELKFYKGPGRNKDKRLDLYDSQINLGKSKVIGSTKHTESEHKVPDVPEWKGQPLSRHVLERQRKDAVREAFLEAKRQKQAKLNEKLNKAQQASSKKASDNGTTTA